MWGKIKMTYCLSLVGAFLWPVGLINLFLCYRYKKAEDDLSIKSHLSDQVGSFYLQTVWLFATFLFIFLISLIGIKSFYFAFVLSCISFILLWGFAIYQYFERLMLNDKKIAISLPCSKQLKNFLSNNK